MVNYTNSLLEKELSDRIKLKLWLDGLAAIGGALAMLAAARLSGAEQWPLWGWPGGYLAVVVALKLRKQRS